MWCCKRRMENISWIERKTNEDVRRTVREKHTFMNAIKSRCLELKKRLDISEELNNIII